MKTNPYPYIKRADLYVQPSRFEGYPVAILEALVLGRLVVSTDNGGAGEMIFPGENGLLCSISADSIVATANELLKDPDRQRLLRRNVEAQDLDAGNQCTVAQLELLLYEKRVDAKCQESV
jgi:glycosyltransferase involved in cell wall biosynthesis